MEKIFVLSENLRMLSEEGRIMRLPATIFAILVLGAVGCGDVGGGMPSGDPDDATDSNTEPFIDEGTLASVPETTVLEVSGVLFPRHEFGDIPAALASGTLDVDGNGCLRLTTTEGDPGSTIIWPPEYSLLSRGGELRILNGEGRVAAFVGDRVQVGGGFIGSSLEGISGVDDATRRETMDRCPGEYLYAGNIRRGQD